MYTDLTLKPIKINDQYVDLDGNQYPSNFPKEKISSLVKVKETSPPTDKNVVVTGFYINENYEQVWETRPKTVVELSREKNQKRIDALADKWPDAFDLLDDILNRGIASVKEERDAIKLANPKGE